MNGFLYGVALQWKLDIRSKSLLVTCYIVQQCCTIPRTYHVLPNRRYLQIRYIFPLLLSHHLLQLLQLVGMRSILIPWWKLRESTKLD